MCVQKKIENSIDTRRERRIIFSENECDHGGLFEFENSFRSIREKFFLNNHQFDSFDSK